MGGDEGKEEESEVSSEGSHSEQFFRWMSP
jgi:hypothetical protein